MNYIKERSKGKGTLLFTTDTDLVPSQEWHTITCCHCNRVFVVIPGSGAIRGYCPSCDASTCGNPRCQWNPTAVRGCTPYEKKIEAMENRHRLHKAMERGCDH